MDPPPKLENKPRLYIRLHNPLNLLLGGQQRAIVFALVHRSALVLVEKPTGALDTYTSQEVMNLLAKLNQQSITIRNSDTQKPSLFEEVEIEGINKQ